MVSRKDLFVALGAAIAALLAAAVEAPDPCCLRVTPYHIQALAQRMAQRFQALEYRAQDLRGVFASFQAVHGNVSHRLRYLEVEHAHLTEIVSRLDSRLQWLEEERKVEDYRKKVGYYRGHRSSRSTSRRTKNIPSGRHHRFRSKFNTLRVDSESFKNDKRSETARRQIAPVSFRKKRESAFPMAAFPFVRFRRSDASMLPPLRVHLEQPEEQSVDISSIESHSSLLPIDEESLNANSNLQSGEREPQVGGVHSPSDSPPPEASAGDAPVFVGGPVDGGGAIMGASGTTPTPLWQLEESADALLQAMSAGDEDAADALLLPLQLPLAGAAADSVSYWSPVNETDSLEQLFGPSSATPAAAREGCPGHANCEEAVTEAAVTPPTSMIHYSATAPEETQDSTESNPPFNMVLDSNDLHPTPSIINNTIPAEPTVKSKPKCQGTVTSTGPPTQDSLASPLVNDSQSALDIFSPGVGGAGEGGSEGDAAQHELSDAELQEALRELDALLQRPPAEAPPPDPEKLLLKRALKLALAALERTSDACLTLVNFTADAFEGLAAAEGMTGAAGSGELRDGSPTAA